MSLTEVKEDILASARQKAEQQRKETLKMIAEIKAKAKDEAKQNQEAIAQKTKLLLASIEQQELALARSESKRILLDNQKVSLDKVMQNLQEEIAKLAPKKREQMCSRLLKKAQKELDTKYVYTNEKDKKSITGNIITQKNADILGGIIAENKDGTVRVNYSFETLVEEIRKKELPKIAKELM